MKHFGKNAYININDEEASLIIFIFFTLMKKKEAKLVFYISKINISISLYFYFDGMQSKYKQEHVLFFVCFKTGNKNR